MNELPSSIEAYLEDAGFSGSEILILRRLMDGEPLTIRQLGAKTGKSTGVLDQAMKKLIKKNIIKKSLINDTPKYSLDSLETVVEWMQDDMEQKREMLLRRHQNFESFVTSIESGSKRPDIEHFEGDSGIKQAYIKLLNGPGEILHYLPVQYKEEEDPLRDFRVQYFRERQMRKMFSRVLAHDTILGHRYQSRDAFEYRKTVLVPEKEYPFTFEKIITGDRIACFDHTAKTACVIRYPELADVEKTLFDAIWRQVQVKPAEDGVPVATRQEPEKIAFSTEAMSQLREFFLSRSSIVSFGILAALAFVTTYALSMHNASITMDRIKERVKSIAATAALQFSAEDIEKIHRIEDVQKPEYAKLVHHLNRIRRENDGVMFAYILRPTSEQGVWTFVADADALNPFEVRDVNVDGEITDEDHLAPPGEVYAETSSYPNDLFRLYEAASYDPATDKWGTHITGSAPIVNADGEPVAIIGVDVETSYWNDVSRSSFWPFASFVGFFLLFVIVRLGAYNRVFLREHMNAFRMRRVMALIAIGAVVSFGCAGWLYIYEVQDRIEMTRRRILTIATTGALQFSADELENVRTLKDVENPEYRLLLQKLHAIQWQNGHIKYAYLFRPVVGTTTFEFIADADALSTDIFADTDMDGNGVINASDETPYPGLSYDISHIEILRERRFFTPIVTETPYIDKWGAVFSGYAPIRDQSDSVVALLAIDADAMSVYMPSMMVFMPIIVFIAIIACYLFFTTDFRRSLAYVFARVLCTKKVMYSFVALLMAVYWVVFAFAYYHRNVVREETGKRLMAIAATAASQFDPEDLEKLRFTRDMKSSEYQKVFKKLNEIRDANPEFAWIYILRPTDEESMWEFVADADSNLFLPFSEDLNNDHLLNEADEAVSPGVKYFQTAKVYKDAMHRASYSKYIITDQWGSFITGAAPIKSEGETVAILAVDLDLK